MVNWGATSNSAYSSLQYLPKVTGPLSVPVGKRGGAVRHPLLWAVSARPRLSAGTAAG
jgi:hypothetical protein